MSPLRILAIALAAALCLGAAKPAPLAYEVSPEIRAGRLQALDVTLKLTAGPDGRVQLKLPDAAAGVTELWRNFRDVRVEGATSVTAPKPAERLIEAAPGAPLTVRYRVVSAYDHDPSVREEETYNPLIRPTRFWIYGEALFATPDGARGPATFRWIGAPPGFGFASDLEQAGGKPMSLHDLEESVLVGGPDLKTVRREVGGAPVTVASIGAFDFPLDAFTNVAVKIIAGERAFWGGREGPFLVAMAPLAPVKGSIDYRGEGRGDAFAIQAGADTPLKSLKSLLAHEYFHTWNPRRLGGMQDGPAERADYWFTEGFTDFYARRLALRTGVFSLDEFVGAWNEMLREAAASPYSTAPNDRVVADFWKDYAVQKLPYERGAILAAAWDARLRAASRGKVGLDDVMRAMRDHAAKLGDKSPEAPQLFIATARRFGLDVRPEIDRIIEKGAPAMLPPEAFGGCVTVTTRQVPVFQRGYEVQTTNGVRVLTKVEPGTAAYAAGLRDGMTYVRRDAGQEGDSSTPYQVRIKDGGVERVVSFLPAGEAMETLQQLAIPRDLTPAARAACAKAVADAR